jgi:hypothetical protein
MFCRTCGLSMSDTAAFCPTCGTKVLSGAAPPAGPITEAAPPVTSPPLGGPSKTASFVNKNGLWLIVAAVVSAALLLAVIVGVGMRHSVTTTSDVISLSDYSSVENGMSLSTVDSYLGGTPKSQTPDASIVGGVDYRWENRDGSSVTVVIVNDRVVGKSESGLEAPRLGVNRSIFAMLSLFGLVMGVVWFLCMTVCLYLATLVVDCTLTPLQVLAISGICAAITMLVPLGLFVAPVVAFVLLMKWGGAEVVDAIIILVADLVLTLVAGYLLGGLMGAAMGFGFRL